MNTTVVYLQEYILMFVPIYNFIVDIWGSIGYLSNFYKTPLFEESWSSLLHHHKKIPYGIRMSYRAY